MAQFLARIYKMLSCKSIYSSYTVVSHFDYFVFHKIGERIRSAVICILASQNRRNAHNKNHNTLLLCIRLKEMYSYILSLIGKVNFTQLLYSTNKANSLSYSELLNIVMQVVFKVVFCEFFVDIKSQQRKKNSHCNTLFKLGQRRVQNPEKVGLLQPISFLGV